MANEVLRHLKKGNFPRHHDQHLQSCGHRLRIYPPSRCAGTATVASAPAPAWKLTVCSGSSAP
jgi:hypothetical protein